MAAEAMQALSETGELDEAVIQGKYEDFLSIMKVRLYAGA